MNSFAQPNLVKVEMNGSRRVTDVYADQNFRQDVVNNDINLSNKRAKMTRPQSKVLTSLSNKSLKPRCASAPPVPRLINNSIKIAPVTSLPRKERVNSAKSSVSMERSKSTKKREDALTLKKKRAAVEK